MDLSHWHYVGSSQITCALGELGLAVLSEQELNTAEQNTLRDGLDRMFDDIFRLRRIKNQEDQNRRALIVSDTYRCFLANNIGAPYKEVPNEYCSRYCCWEKPWLQVETVLGPLTLGWRKRVLNLSWPPGALNKTAGLLFPDEDVTKGGSYIHAESYAKATAYIGVLLTAFSEQCNGKQSGTESAGVAAG